MPRTEPLETKNGTGLGVSRASDRRRHGSIRGQLKRERARSPRSARMNFIQRTNVKRLNVKHLSAIASRFCVIESSPSPKRPQPRNAPADSLVHHSAEAASMRGAVQGGGAGFDSRRVVSRIISMGGLSTRLRFAGSCVSRSSDIGIARGKSDAACEGTGCIPERAQSRPASRRSARDRGRILHEERSRSVVSPDTT